MSSHAQTGENATKDARPKLSKVTGEQLVEEHLTYRTTFFVYFAYAVFLIFGHIGRIILKIGVMLGVRKNFFAVPSGYAPLFKELQYFWLVWIYQRIRDLFERPIASVPGGYVEVLNRTSDDGNASFRLTGGTTRALNLSSYNYLGFGENSGPVIDTVLDSLDQYSFSTASARMEAGNYQVVEELEKAIAKFVGKPAAMVFGMGFATNSTTIPALSGKGSLIISDSLNHASIACGSKDSGAKIIVFKHNDVADLERILRASIVEGQPRTRRPWKRIVIIVEGIYSMEGEIIRLPEIVALKKKYKAYLYVDEAHSIGALGRRGRGVCEHWGVNPDDVDVLMGTFTKAFGSVGGYISGSEGLIAHLRHTSYGMLYSPAMSPPCAQQALSALRMIAGEDGTKEGERRLQQLRDNSNYFRKELKKRGFHVFGDPDSPIVPMMVYHPCKMPGFSRELLKRGIIVVLVGFPVTPLLLSRVRFCLSSAHSRQDLEIAIKEIDDLGDILLLKYGLKKERLGIEDGKKHQ